MNQISTLEVVHEFFGKLGLMSKFVKLNIQSNSVITITVIRTNGYSEQLQPFGLVQHVLTIKFHAYKEQTFHKSRL